MINDRSGSGHLKRSIVIDLDSLAKRTVFNLFEGNVGLIIRLVKHNDLVLFGFF